MVANEWDRTNSPGPLRLLSQLLGDVIISVDTAQRQAQARGHGLRAEMRVLLTHGFLHLLGYDHERGQEEHDEVCSTRNLFSWLASSGVRRSMAPLLTIDSTSVRIAFADKDGGRRGSRHGQTLLGGRRTYCERICATYRGK